MLLTTLATLIKLIPLGWNSQNFSRQIHKIFLTLDLKNLKNFKLKIFFEADFIKD